VAAVTKRLKADARLRMNGLGTLEMKTRGAHERGRNPAIGESIQIKTSKTVAFPSAKELKKAN
jgi:nucleoid DNA-binding protein